LTAYALRPYNKCDIGGVEKMVLDFSKFFKSRLVARQRARELIDFLREECENNGGISEHVKPETLLEDVTQVFLESEQRRK
jgi:hypothetical protein